MAWQAPPVVLSTRQRAILERMRNARTSKRCRAERASILLLSAEGKSNLRIALALGIGREKVAQWRNRWSAHAANLAEAERVGAAERDYRKRIIALLDDAPRSGCPGKFSAEQVCQILAVACESPAHGGTAVSHWSLSSLAKEVVARGIVESISTSKLHVFLKSGGIKTAQEHHMDSHAGEG